jgi:hypothetical protein
MRILYNSSSEQVKIPISTGGGYQFVLLWFEDDNDWFVYFCDTNLSKTYIHRIVNKFAVNAAELFSGLNMEQLPEDQFTYYESWINSNFNYQGLHKDEKLDE